MVDNIAEKNTKESIDFKALTYKDTRILTNFLSDQGKILPRRVTGLSSKEQKKVPPAGNSLNPEKRQTPSPRCRGAGGREDQRPP